MSPQLTKKNVNEAKFSRVVRLGKEFYFSEDHLDTHKDVAIENGAPRTEKPIVQDAGFLEKTEMGINGKFVIEDSTSSCKIEGDPSQARSESQDLLRKILGERAF